MITVPDKFENLTMQQREELARVGFDLVKNFEQNILSDALVNSRFQMFSNEQQRLQEIMNSNNQQIFNTCDKDNMFT